jgi:hypothetical protein
MLATALTMSVGVANAGSRATVTHYTAHYSCGCFGTFDVRGIHLTNTRFPGTDDGLGGATGGRDNFTGTVSEPPATETVWNNSNVGPWCSDYDGQCTTDWSVRFEPDGSLSGWAVYPAS